MVGLPSEDENPSALAEDQIRKPPGWAALIVFVSMIQDSKSERVDVAGATELYLFQNEVIRTKSIDEGS